MINASTSNLNPIKPWVSIGTILKPVGLRGEVRVFVKTDFIKERFSKGQIVYINRNQDYQPLEIESYRTQKNFVIISFKDHSDIESIKPLLKEELWILREQRPSLALDEYYFDQLLHLEVYQHQQHIGEVIEVFEQPSSTVLRIKTEKSSFLLPFVKAFVKEVNLEQKRLEVELIEGFYED